MSLVVCCNAVLLRSDLPVNVESVVTAKYTPHYTARHDKDHVTVSRTIHYVT